MQEDEGLRRDPPPRTPVTSGAIQGSQASQTTRISCTRGFVQWLERHKLSIAFTSYQSGKLYLAGIDDQQRLALHEVAVGRAMGLWADPQRLLVVAIFQLWRFENILASGQHAEGRDRYYVPRVAHTTGDLDIHEIGVMPDGRIVFVNTLHSCLAELSNTHSFRSIWTPPFISKLAAEDRCHLNGLAMREGKPAYVTAVCRSDIVDGWRARRAEGGCVVDVADNRIVSERLSMPHSPRWHDGALWVLNSGTGHLGTVDLASGAFTPRTFCPGFLRGLAFHNNHAVVGLSLPRDGSFAGLQLDTELKRRDADPWCGIQVIDLASGDIVEWIRLEGAVTELFDVSVIPGVRWPTAASFLAEDIRGIISIEGG